MLCVRSNFGEKCALFSFSEQHLIIVTADILKSSFSAVSNGKACSSYEMSSYVFEQRAKSYVGFIFGIENVQFSKKHA
jgi:hypothetical protein